MTMTSKQRSYYGVVRTNKYIKGRPRRAPGTNTKGPEGSRRVRKVSEAAGKVSGGTGRVREAREGV
jgi:hypothetical protein